MWIRSVPLTEGVPSGSGLSNNKAKMSVIEEPQIPMIKGHLFRVSYRRVENNQKGKRKGQFRPAEASIIDFFSNLTLVR